MPPWTCRAAERFPAGDGGWRFAAENLSMLYMRPTRSWPMRPRSRSWPRGWTELVIAMVRDLTETKRSAHEGHFFEFLFKLIGDADSSHQVLTAAVQTICHFTRCAMGQVWLPAGDVLVCSPTWFCSGYGFEKLHAAGEEVSYEPGQGIPAEHRERVFGVFERLDGPSTGAGTGMGLAICRKIVEVLGGGIGIEGDHGTDVRILLPAAVGARWPSHQLTAGSMR
jgi:hypothetical protein